MVAIEPLLECLRLTLADGPRLRLAVLFGSAARGALRADSDLDVGIVPENPTLALNEELDLQRRLERACRRPVDLVRLDHASTLVRWEAARSAVLVVADPPAAFPRFLASAALEHADLMTVLAPAAERLRVRLAEATASPADRPRAQP